MEGSLLGERRQEAGGRLGHDVEDDVSQPKLIDSLSGIKIELVACGEYHTAWRYLYMG